MCLLSGLVPLLCLAAGLTSLLLIPLLTMFFRRPKRDEPTTESQPKTQVFFRIKCLNFLKDYFYLRSISLLKTSIHDPVTLIPALLEPVNHFDIHVDFVDDQMSDDSSSSSDQDNLDQTSPLGNGSDLVRLGSSSGAVYCDSGGVELESASCLIPKD